MFHGRRGDGVTLSLDLAPCGRGGAGPGLARADRGTWNLFHGTAGGVGEAARIAAATAKRPWAKGSMKGPPAKNATKKARRMKYQKKE